MREGVCPQEGHHTGSCSVSTKACLETFKKWEKRQHLPKGIKISINVTRVDRCKNNPLKILEVKCMDSCESPYSLGENPPNLDKF